jgi:hypothetical protein
MSNNIKTEHESTVTAWYYDCNSIGPGGIRHGSPNAHDIKWARKHGCEIRTLVHSNAAISQTAAAIVEYAGDEHHHSKRIRALTDLPIGTKLYTAAPRENPTAWRGVDVEGDYLYYDVFPDKISDEQRRQLHVEPLYTSSQSSEISVPSENEIEEAVEQIAAFMDGGYRQYAIDVLRAILVKVQS